MSAAEDEPVFECVEPEREWILSEQERLRATMTNESTIDLEEHAELVAAEVKRARRAR